MIIDGSFPIISPLVLHFRIRMKRTNFELSIWPKPIPVINVKKLQFIHMLTAIDHRTSKTAKIKKLYYYITAHRRTSCAAV